MSLRTTMALLLSLIATSSLSLAAKAETDCSFDRAALLALDQQTFDQDTSQGWQAIALRGEPCMEVAADLVREYRETHNLDAEILYWHEGQLRATAGQILEAIELFEKARGPSDSGLGWNLYVDATIAFMKEDRSALLAAREALSQLPQAPNLNVVDMLIACFGQPYKEAYGRCEK